MPDLQCAEEGTKSIDESLLLSGLGIVLDSLTDKMTYCYLGLALLCPPQMCRVRQVVEVVAGSLRWGAAGTESKESFQNIRNIRKFEHSYLQSDYDSA